MFGQALNYAREVCRCRSFGAGMDVDVNTSLGLHPGPPKDERKRIASPARFRKPGHDPGLEWQNECNQPGYDDGGWN